MLKKLGAMALVLIVLAGAVVVGVNYVGINLPVQSAIGKDSRNKPVQVAVYLDHLVDPKALVFDLRGFDGEASMADVFRIFLQSAQALKGKDFDIVYLAYKGEKKFLIKGDFFKTLGMEFDFQKPMYTIRTFPSHVYKLNGSRAYGDWTGGILGVLGKQMEEFTDFHKKWYAQDMATVK